MKPWGLFILLGILWGCAEKKTDFSGNTPIKINDFNKAFKIKSLPMAISDTNLKSLADTLIIGKKALAQFVPDSVVNMILPNANEKAKLFPLIKIEKETEYYLLLDVRHPTKDEIVVLVFSKKNKYLDFKVITDFLFANKGSHKYGKSININKEPTFIVEENKLDDENVLIYEKTGYALSEDHFKMIYFDSNKKMASKNIINPIDTLPMNNVWSGDYKRDNKNFISIRDYNNQPNKYLFFLHFEKREGTCTGELKGLLNFSKNTATFNEKGDPCIIHFTINGNSIAIKEDGNCGNHRDMNCYFNDQYERKKRPKKKK